MQFFPLIAIFIFDCEFLRAGEALFGDDRTTDNCLLSKINLKPPAIGI